MAIQMGIVLIRPVVFLSLQSDSMDFRLILFLTSMIKKTYKYYKNTNI
jgi:hypothetical protein